jgi:protein associated with RNAse G/E
VFPDYHYKVLDEAEYASHKKLYGYSDELDHIFREQLDILIEMTENMEGPFRPGFAEKWYDAYLKSEKEKV